jgi:phage repressor protein C with HTH and peptisase S24 domain
MLSHEAIWAAIDTLARINGLSPSGLARRAGLDATAFNRSKRNNADGRPRWPSTESLARILDVTGCSLAEFESLAAGAGSDRRIRSEAGMPHTVPLIGFAQAGAGGFFDDAGFPAGFGWDEVELPHRAGDHAYALHVQGDSMLPLYRDGDTLIVDPQASPRRGDRVVVRTREGEIMAKVLERNGSGRIELRSLNPEHPDRIFDRRDIDWIARIVWASQ